MLLLLKAWTAAAAAADEDEDDELEEDDEDEVPFEAGGELRLRSVTPLLLLLETAVVVSMESKPVSVVGVS